MKKNAVEVGATYLAKVSGRLVTVRLDADSPHGGWQATNLATRKRVYIKSAQRLRRPVGGTPAAAAAGLPAGEAAEATTAKGEDRNDRDIDRAPRSELTLEEAAKLEKVRAAKAANNKPVDPNRCATPRCTGQPALTHLGRPLCQKCWERHCQAESDMEAVARMAATRNEPAPADGATTEDLAGAAAAPALSACNAQAGNQEENDMASKKSKKSSKGGAKAKAGAKTKPAAKVGPRNILIADKPKAKREKNEKKLSALDAAAQILAKASGPMRSKELIATMAERGLWTSPGGKTPHATLDAAMRREIRTKGKDARFKTADRGHFAFNG